MKHWIIALELTALLQLPAAATELKPDVINAATFTGKLPSGVGLTLSRSRFRCYLIEPGSLRVRSTAGSATMSRKHFGPSQRRTVFRPARFLPRRYGPSFSKAQVLRSSLNTP